MAMTSLTQIARLAEDLAYQATAAKILDPVSPEASAQHLKNARTLYDQLGVELSKTERTDGCAA